MSNIYKNRNQEIDDLKGEIDKYRPFSKELVKELREYYRIGFAYTSNALEGNSLTESETKVVIEDGLTIGGRPIREINEALGHSDAYTLLEKLSDNKMVTETNILELHRLFYFRIDENKAGKYRKEQVFISGTDYLPPDFSDIPKLMKEFINSMSELKASLHPVYYAAKLHERIATIHPFSDGNGRTARLVMNLALLQAGYPLAIIPPILRSEYILAIRLANKDNVDPFYNFISNVEYESARDYVRLLKHYKH
ncbi:MAG: Fic family protein [Endomicrobium sp.]|jgi:Fic family protein|nr:Fic family protein [Endomicrobium sp.]MDR2399768.1 Fic family protein [Endomicrobium sp.]